MAAASQFELHLSHANGRRDIVHLSCPDAQLITHMRRLADASGAVELIVRHNGGVLFTLVSDQKRGHGA